MRARILGTLCLSIALVMSMSGFAAASSGLVTKTGCGLATCHSHPGFADFGSWHTSHQSAPIYLPCERCHPNNHTQVGPPSAPDATYSLAEACTPCHTAATITAPAHATAGITTCVGCHPAVGALSGTVVGPNGQLGGVSVRVSGVPPVLSYADGSYFVSGVSPGTYTVTYEKAGFVSQTIAGVGIVNGGTAARDVTLAAVTVVAPVVADTVVTLTSSSRSALPYGSTFVVSGALTTVGSGLGVSEVPLVLKSSADGSTWTASGPTALTIAGGSFLFAVRPTTKTYYRVDFAGDATHRGSASGSVYVTSKVYLTTPIAPAVISRLHYYTIYGYLRPRHPARSYSVRIYRWRYVSGRWKGYGYVSARASDYLSYTRYSRSMRLPYAGRWRLRAYHADAGHVATWSSHYDYVKVK